LRVAVDQRNVMAAHLELAGDADRQGCLANTAFALSDGDEVSHWRIIWSEEPKWLSA